MKIFKVILLSLLICLLCSYLVISLTGCVGEVSSSEDPAKDLYSCSIKVLKCKKTQKDVQHVFIYQPPPSGGCYSEQKDLRVSKKIYCEPQINWVVDNIVYEKLRGARWIMTRYADRLSQADPFLHFKIIHDVEGIYVAYDSRATTVPRWLGDKKIFKPALGPGSKPIPIVITKTDNSSKKISLNIYRYKGSTKVNSEVKIPGNFDNSTAFPPGFDTKEAAMYMVIIKPKESTDCSTSDVQTTLSFDRCFSSMAEAEKATKKECEDYISSHLSTEKLVCGIPFCTTDEDCPSDDVLKDRYKISLKQRPVPSNAEVEFDPKKFTSTAKFKVVGKTYTQNVKGGARLKYDVNGFGQLKNVKVLTLNLKVDPLNTDVGTFSNISITLLAPTIAQCKDASPPYHKPCTLYQIPTSDFVACLNTKLDGKQLLFIGDNKKQPLDLQINNTTKTFWIKGGFSTTILVDGDSKPVNIDIDLTGRFVNFQPNAVGIESDKEAECAENKNQTELVLRSSGSFDIIDPLPTNKPNYKWYEDYGLVTEKLWGEGKELKIPPYQLDYGVHYFTLLVKDKDGAVDTDTFPVVVKDTKPPKLYIPSDTYRLIFPPYGGPVHVYIGEASGSDACSDKVMITNDAPSGHMFQPGHITPVTWVADDGRGNTTKKGQDIHLFIIEDRFNPNIFIVNLKNIIFHVIKSIQKVQMTMEECGPEIRCPMEFHPLVVVFEQLMELTMEMEVQEDQQRIKGEIMERLEPTLGALREADQLIARSYEVGDEFMEFRERAMGHLHHAQELMHGLMEMPER